MPDRTNEIAPIRFSSAPAIWIEGEDEGEGERVEYVNSLTTSSRGKFRIFLFRGRPGKKIAESRFDVFA